MLPMASPANRRDGIGLLAALAIGAALFVGISIVATGGRGLGFTDSGFLRRPRAPSPSSSLPTTSPEASSSPAAPAPGPNLSPLRARVRLAQTGLEEALRTGRPDSIEAARHSLEKAQAELGRATRQSAPASP